MTLKEKLDAFQGSTLYDKVRTSEGSVLLSEGAAFAHEKLGLAWLLAVLAKRARARTGMFHADVELNEHAHVRVLGELVLLPLDAPHPEAPLTFTLYVTHAPYLGASLPVVVLESELD